MAVRRFTVCPDFLRPMSDQLEAGQYVLASDHDAEVARLESALAASEERGRRLEAAPREAITYVELDSEYPVVMVVGWRTALAQASAASGGGE